MKFKKIISKLLITFFFLLPAKSEIEINVSTAILQDYLSGEILYEKDPDQKIYPASMTKIMTSIIAFDLIKKHDTLNIRKHGGIDLATIQKWINFHFSICLDLFGQEKSTNAANFYIGGMSVWVGFKQTGINYTRPERAFGSSTNNLVKNILASILIYNH